MGRRDVSSQLVERAIDSACMMDHGGAAPSPIGTRVLVCEDDARLREVLCRGLAAAGLAVVGGYGTGEDAVAAALRDPPSVLLLDLELPGMSGLEVIAALVGKVPSEILVLTTFADERQVYLAICGGAAGYLTKRTPLAQLIVAIGEVHAGGTVIDPALARRFWNYFQSQSGQGGADPYGLTPEELEVLALVGRGLTNPEVGRVIGRTRRAIKLDLERIYRKLGVSNRVDAVVKAVARGLIKVER
jgi:two-component system response regulator DegU